MMCLHKAERLLCSKAKGRQKPSRLHVIKQMKHATELMREWEAVIAMKVPKRIKGLE